MITDVINAVQSIVEGVAQRGRYYSVQDLGTSYKFFTYNTYWAAVGNTISVEGASLAIQEVLCNQWIRVAKPDPEPEAFASPGIFSLRPALTFKPGTITRVSAELTAIQYTEDFCPLVYLVEPMTSTQNNDRRSAIGENAELRLFVLDQCNDQDLLTSADYRTAVHNKTDRITQEIVNAFERSPLIGKLPTSRTWNYINVGEYNEKGTTKKLFIYFMSGTEFRMTLPLMKRCNC